MLVLVMRHLESQKNVSKTFSSLNDHEKLTLDGEMTGKKIANDIYEFVKAHDLKVKNVYCANSNRAISTAKIIAELLSVDIRSFDELRSNKSGTLLGKSEQEAASINPLFVHQLKLFRAGLFSSYNFVNVYQREDKHDFEKRVMNCVASIINDDTEELKIIVLHHSSLTATMINIARKIYSYPTDFYGHVACELGNIFLWNSKEILLCNESTSLNIEPCKW